MKWTDRGVPVECKARDQAKPVERQKRSKHAACAAGLVTSRCEATVAPASAATLPQIPEKGAVRCKVP